MEFFFITSNAVSTTYKYVEMQNTVTDRSEPASEPLGVKIFSALLIPLLLFGLLVWLTKNQRDMVADQKRKADENTEAIKRNNELLRENIQLQREMLEAIRKKVE